MVKPKTLYIKNKFKTGAFALFNEIFWRRKLAKKLKKENTSKWFLAFSYVAVEELWKVTLWGLWLFETTFI